MPLLDSTGNIARIVNGKLVSVVNVAPTLCEDATFPALVVQVVGGVAVFTSPYDPAFVAAVKALGGARWQPESKSWAIRLTDYTRVRVNALAVQAGSVHDPDGSLTQEAAAAEAAEPAPVSTDVDSAGDVDSVTYPKVSVTVTGDVVLFASPYDPEFVADAKTHGARWLPANRAWKIVLDDTNAIDSNRPDVCAFAVDCGLVHDPDGELTRLPVPVLAPVNAVDIAGTDSAHLRLHQAQVVGAVLAGRRRVLLADEPGLGKTATALISAAAVDAYPMVVVCPSVVKMVWAREAARWTPEARVVVLSGRKAHTADIAGADIVILNYDILSAWEDTLTRQHPATVVLDEAHYAKDQRSARGLAAIRLCHGAGPEALIMALTGTPVPNRVIDLAGPLDCLGWLAPMGGFWNFAKRYCNARPDSFGGWVMTGAEHLPELHEKLAKAGMIRRLKTELGDMPARTVVDLPVILTSDGARNVKAAQKALTDSLVSRVRMTASGGKITKTLVRTVVATALADSESGVGAALMSLRMAVGEAKVPLIADQARHIAESTGKVVVFAHHRSVQAGIAEALKDLGVVTITGAQSAEARQASIDAFQTDSAVRVLVASIKAAGVGITLTAASNVVLGELPWGPADQDQAIDRVHRIGQAMPVTAWRVLAEGSLDGRIAKLIEEKAVAADAVVDGISADADATDATATPRRSRSIRTQILTEMVLEALKIVDQDEDNADIANTANAA